MIWGKKEQFLLWSVAYVPLFLIMIFRLIDEREVLKKCDWIKMIIDYLGDDCFNLIVFILILIFSIFCYRLVTLFLFRGRDTRLKSMQTGRKVYIKHYEKINVNENSFFLVTLLIPLVSIDHSSIINFLITVSIIFFIILIYVRGDYLSICPPFYVSSKHVYKATISLSDEDESQIKEVTIITSDKYLDLNYCFRGEELVKDIFYVVPE